MDRKINIAVFTAYFYPHEGGTEKYAQELFRDLKDVDVTIITSNSNDAKFHEKRFGMDIYRFRCWHLLDKTYPVIKFTEYKDIEKLFKDSNNKFDYIVTQTRFFNTAYIGCRIAKKFKIPLIHIEHGTMHSPIKNPLLRLFGRIYDHTIGRYIIKNSSRLIGISGASERFVKHLYPDAKTDRIYNSVDTKIFEKIPEKRQMLLKRSLRIKDEKVILFVGRIIYAKGIQDMLEACEGMEDVKVLIIGDGNYLDTLKKRYPWAIFLGQKNIDEIIRYLSIADIFINPSYAEGLPTSILEAGAMGVPAIATDVGGTGEIIDDGEDGYLIRPKNPAEIRRKISKLLQDDALRKKFSKNIRLKIRREFDWKTSRERFENIIHKAR